MASVERHYRLWLLLLWFVAAITAIAVNRDAILHFRFWDPDDAMRLVEVRDWLGGQSWFDVAQHRMNLPAGLSMHWSRLVDLPLAALIALLKPWAGQRIAETAAAVVVPMILLGLTMALVGEIARRRSGASGALLAAALCLLSIGTWYAMPPMRIDHHGWQVVVGLGMVLALVAGENRRAAILAGLCGAFWAHISLEGIAFTAGAGAWLGLLWIRDPRELRLPAFLMALAVGSTALYLASHGIQTIGSTFCDQVSAVHIAIFALAALLSCAAAMRAPRSRLGRLAAMALLAMSCAALYRYWAPQCAAGPFGTLGPLGYHLWYRNVPEGVPLWHNQVATWLLWGVFPWIGLTGALATALRPSPSPRAHWAYCTLLAIATAIALLVTRAGAFANLLAIPGAVSLIMLAFARTENWSPPVRVVARAVALLLLSPIAAEMTPALLPAGDATAAKPVADRRCGTIDALAPLDHFARTTILAPLELGPNLLAATHHDAVTGPYHRDPQALEDVLRFFASPDAHAIASRRHATLLVFCNGRNEMATIAKFAPHGLAAQLRQNGAPSWLHPVSLPGTAGLQIYRIGP